MTSQLRHTKGAEQDAAAGGREHRKITLTTGGTALASIEFKQVTGCTYAYIRYKAEGRTHSRFVGKKSDDDRGRALRAAWDEAKRKGFVVEIQSASRAQKEDELTTEDEFRNAVRSLIARGTYPDNTAIRQLLGLPSWQPRSGLKGDQTRWRVEEVERAGYDWEQSKRLQRLVKQSSA